MRISVHTECFISIYLCKEQLLASQIQRWTEDFMSPWSRMSLVCLPGALSKVSREGVHFLISCISCVKVRESYALSTQFGFNHIINDVQFQVEADCRFQSIVGDVSQKVCVVASPWSHSHPAPPDRAEQSNGSQAAPHSRFLNRYNPSIQRCQINHRSRFSLFYVHYKPCFAWKCFWTILLFFHLFSHCKITHDSSIFLNNFEIMRNVSQQIASIVEIRRRIPILRVLSV